jgi:L-alanine-DL-glutamate epimerase-like enolase superfamily enzyme
VRARAYTIPTDEPEQDGTLDWDSTTLIVATVEAGGYEGIGYTYAGKGNATLISGKLAKALKGQDAFDIPGCVAIMEREVRNMGRRGLAGTAISAVDVALWDLKAKLLELPLCKLLGMARDSVPVYGSGGFTTYSLEHLGEQLAGWVSAGIPRVKIKVGTVPDDDPARVRAARDAIGPQAELFVDANGGYTVKQALALAERFRDEAQVSWLEEPVSSDDLEGLALVRRRAPAGIEVAAGEYGHDASYFQRMLQAGAVDVLQADVTRCAGITELMRVDGLCRGHLRPLSLHCGPAVHLHPGLALEQLVHLEYFHDHVRIEQMLFDGVPEPRDGALYPDLDRPGIGLELKREEAERYAL